MKKTRIALIHSAVALVMCAAMLAGSTFAWFTDTASSPQNIIKSGKLDLAMYWTEDLTGNWNKIEEDAASPIFDYDKWEPGYTDVKYIKIANEGNLAFQYAMEVVPDGAVTALADAIDVYFIDNPTENITRDALAALTPVATLSEVISGTTTGTGILLPVGEDDGNNTPAGEVTVAVAMKMREAAGNQYQGMSLSANADGTATTFSVRLMATQYTYEEDSFGNDYDVEAELPGLQLPGGNVNESVNISTNKNDNGTVKDDVTVGDSDGVNAKIPSGTVVEEGATELKLTVSRKANSDSNITTGTNEELLALDVHIEGVAENNTVPIVVNLGQIMPVGLNIGNITLYHVENGNINAMTRVDTVEGLIAHNTFYYDPATGDVSVALATFSEVAVVSDTENAWNGEVATAFAGGTGTEADPYIIANADQLAYMGDRVSNDNENYGSAHYKLIADVNIGGSDNSANIFYPIGYQKQGTGTNKADEVWYTKGGEFSGTFDGTGHKISGIYQNTWSMDGNYDNGYYNAAMGLFGYVNGGTVKNLTIDNFYSEGEFAPTGCVAAMAEGKCTFENISITNSHPQTYNTGVAGIVGWDEGDKSNYTFKNITVDSSNTISALWGSWDVAAAGLLGYLGGNSEANFTNCNVSATIDVYNDVCGNYQYYWYRYCGAFIGTVDKRLDNGKGALNLSNVTAENCTVNFGDRHEYYYCEFEKNTQASYTEDYQFSRVPHSELNFTDSNGNGVVDANERDSVTGCNHTHTSAEDKQAIYLPFRQLFGGYGWGVDGVDLDEYKNLDIYVEGSIADTEQEKSVTKFESVNSEPLSRYNNKLISVGELFKAAEDVTPEIDKSNVQVFVSPVGDESTVAGVYVPDTTDWTNGTLTFSGQGAATITITDYYFCTPTTITVNVTERKPEEKFESKFTGNFLYRVGNSNDVKLDSLFKAKDGEEIGTVSVTVDNVNGNAAGTYTPNATWTNGTIQFSGIGVVKVTITDNDYCTSTELTLEVVDAVNATTATGAKSNNVVLLNDCSFSSLEVSGGYTLYGNGFTMTCGSDSVALDMGYSFVTLNNGTLDNVQIVCPNFDYAALYKSNLTSNENRSETDANGKTRYYNAKSGVMASGNSQILNSRISGGRAALNVSGGNVVVDNSRIELGAVASVLVGAANSLTLRDVTLVQKPTASTYDSSKTLMGFSVLYLCDSEGKATPTTLEGSFVQQAWVNADDKQYVPSAGQDIVDGVMKETAFIHNINGKDSLNLGFAYMPEDTQKTVAAPDNITDNRTDKATIPYEMKDVKIQISILSTTVYVYSYKNTNGTADSFKTESEYIPNKYGDIITVAYSDTADGLTTGKSYGTDGWVYELNVDLDKLSGYALDFSKLSMSVNGVTVTDFKVDGSAKPTSPVAVVAGGTTYTLTATVNGKEYTATYKVTGTETSKESPSLVASNYEAGLCVASSYGGTWHGAAPALEGIQIKYWSVAEKQYKTITLSDYTPTTKGQLNGTNTTWTYSPDNGDFTLTLTGGQVHSSNNVYAMPVVCDGKLYFVAASSNGLVNTGNSARTIPVSYSFKDNNNGDVLTFSHTWSVAENKDAQYKYSDFCNGTLTKLTSSSSGGGCVTPDTLITLADGSKVRVDSLKGNEELLVWNLKTGKLDSAPIMFVDSDPEAKMEIVKLRFSDKTEVKVIAEHGFWDYDLNKYVYLDRNADEYIGHTFAKQNGDKLTKVKLVDVEIETEKTTAWSPVTVEHLCYFVNDMLSMPGGVAGLFNIFDVDAETMTYDYDSVAQDIRTYGLFTYEEVNAVAPLSEEMFYAAGGQYLKISIGKGNLTVEELEYMIERYSKFI